MYILKITGESKNYMYEKLHQKIVRSALPNMLITLGTRKLENELTMLTIAIPIEPMFPTIKYANSEYREWAPQNS